MTQGNYITAADVLDDWRDDLLSGKPPTHFPVGNGELARLEFGPGLVSLLGGAPGAGKTALAMQIIFDALRLTPTLRALVCNVEMPPKVLLDRQLARLSGVDATLIRKRLLRAEHAERIDQGIATIAAVADRLRFVRPPFTLDNIAATADAWGHDGHLLMLLDYLQRIAPPGKQENDRGRVNRTMDYLRQFADAGVAVIPISAVGRSKDSMGRSSYAGDGLNLASFRESSELEFGADDAFILHPHGDEAEGELMKLRHLKSRHGECRDLLLRFDRRRQSFTAEAPGNAPTLAKTVDGGKVRSALAAMWNRTPAASEGSGDHDD